MCVCYPLHCGVVKWNMSVANNLFSLSLQVLRTSLFHQCHVDRSAADCSRKQDLGAAIREASSRTAIPCHPLTALPFLVCSLLLAGNTSWVLQARKTNTLQRARNTHGALPASGLHFRALPKFKKVLQRVLNMLWVRPSCKACKAPGDAFASIPEHIPPTLLPKHEVQCLRTHFRRHLRRSIVLKTAQCPSDLSKENCLSGC